MKHSRDKPFINNSQTVCHKWQSQRLKERGDTYQCNRIGRGKGLYETAGS